jgi:hypothetical protein
MQVEVLWNDKHPVPEKSAEMSLGAADTSVCATFEV